LLGGVQRHLVFPPIFHEAFASKSKDHHDPGVETFVTMGSTEPVSTNKISAPETYNLTSGIRPLNVISRLPSARVLHAGGRLATN
jgi:hypothetical protein